MSDRNNRYNEIDKILKEISVIWKEQPDLRLGQLIYDSAKLSSIRSNDVFTIPDRLLLAGARNLSEFHRRFRREQFSEPETERPKDEPTDADKFIEDLKRKLESLRPIIKTLTNYLK